MQVENVQLTAWVILLIMGQLAGFIAGFLQNDHGPAFTVYGWSYPVAKGAARAIQVRYITITSFFKKHSPVLHIRSSPSLAKTVQIV